MSDSFGNLPPSLQKRIDEAFNLATTSTPVPNAAAAIAPTVLAGGFIIDEPTLSPPNHITLSSVPTALSYLDLPPDDEQILAAFRNAASGWSSAMNQFDEQDTNVGLVNRDDWRAVCAVLLGDQHDELGDGETSSVRNAMTDTSSDGDGQDDYSFYEDSGDDYDDVLPSRTRRRHQDPTSGPLRNTLGKHPLSKNQKEACLQAFSLFFPTVPFADLPQQRIMMKDIQQVGTTLGEKLTTDEMTEMLEMFSSSPDKSVNLSDFSRMMVAAKLV